MRKWLLQQRYSAAGLAAIAEGGGSAARTRLQALIEKIGGKVEAFYFTLGGDYHAFAIVAGADPVTGWAAYLTMERTGLSTTDVIELVPTDVVDEGAKMSQKLAG